MIIFDTDTIGSGHPYQGTAGRPILTKNADFDGTQGTIEFYAVGAAGADANAVAGPSLVSSGNFPGIPGNNNEIPTYRRRAPAPTSDRTNEGNP